MVRPLFLFSAIVLGCVSVGSVGFSDMQVNPKGADGWGDPGEGAKMLQMTKDPDVVRDHPLPPEERDHAVPVKAADCMDNGSGGCSISPEAQPTPRGRADGSPANTQQGFKLTQ
jgi:hypothetical protein